MQTRAEGGLQGAGRVTDKMGWVEAEEGADADIRSARGHEKLISCGLSRRRGMRTH